MLVNIQITEDDIKRLVVRELKSKLDIEGLTEADVKFEVKASMNYKSEWEKGEFCASIVTNV